tara:strand:+ start:233 stop:424 length:192 start_codon:yes stop_codon:yes gene_type:complete
MTQQETNANDGEMSGNSGNLQGEQRVQSCGESAIDWVDRLNRISYQRALIKRLDGRYSSRSRT